MALSKKLVKAVKDAQKQAEATVAEVRAALDARMNDVKLDLTPFYAVVGAADLTVDTIKHAAEQLEAARTQAGVADLREGAKKEAAELQQDLQKRIADLQARTTEMQKLAAELAEKVLTQAQDLPARVMNQGLVLASNAKDQYDAAAERGEHVVADLRTQRDKATEDVTKRSQEAVTRAKKVASTVVDEGKDLGQTVAGALQDDVAEIREQLEDAAQAIDEAAAPAAAVAPASPAKKAPAVKKAPAKHAAAKPTPAKHAAAKPAPAKAAATQPKKAAAKKSAAK